LLTAKRAKSLFKRAGDGFRAPARFNYFGSPPKELNHFFWRGARLWLQEETALGPGRPRVPAVGKWQPLPPFSGRALAEILFKRELRV
ncbi:hypothetical protein, partial [uncultured Rikenella sp.]|uniref:hypothetical protein n=1 Tax=uncultured Rikenella sp. TaxID=368003 RepID=UPI002605C715